MGWIILIVLIVIVVLIGVFLVSIYNKLVRLRERTRSAFAQIDVQLERRHDLIPNLVETVKGYMNHERETLEAVVNARAAATQARIEVSGDPENLAAMQKLAQSEGALEGALGRLLAVAEAYPDLKANQNFLHLQEELTATEGRVAYARQFYNDSVLGYNNKLQQFPTMFFARMLKFERREYFEADEAARTTPDVSF